MEELVKDERIKTANELMMAVETEISQIKSGKLKDAQGRLVMRGRAIQMQGVYAYLQAARLQARLGSDVLSRFGLAAEPPNKKRLKAAAA